MDETPSYIDTSTPKLSKKKTIWLILIIIALIASNVSWALFFFKQQGELNTKISILTAKNLKLENDNKTLKEENDKNSSEAANSGDYREIPELGVKYEENDKTKDATYAYVTSKDKNNIIHISTKTLTEAAPVNAEKLGDMEAYKDDFPCTSLDPPATITQTKAKPIDDGSENGVDTAKKIGDYYYTFNSTKLNGSTRCSETDFTKAVDTAKAVFDSLKPIN